MMCVCCLTPYRQTVGAKQTEQPDLRSVCAGETHRSAPSFPNVQPVSSFVLQGAFVTTQRQTRRGVRSEHSPPLRMGSFSRPLHNLPNQEHLPRDSEGTQMGPVPADAQHLTSAVPPSTCCEGALLASASHFIGLLCPTGSQRPRRPWLTNTHPPPPPRQLRGHLDPTGTQGPDAGICFLPPQ